MDTTYKYAGDPADLSGHYSLRSVECPFTLSESELPTNCELRGENTFPPQRHEPGYPPFPGLAGKIWKSQNPKLFHT